MSLDCMSIGGVKRIIFTAKIFYNNTNLSILNKADKPKRSSEQRFCANVGYRYALHYAMHTTHPQLKLLKLSNKFTCKKIKKYYELNFYSANYNP